MSRAYVMSYIFLSRTMCFILFKALLSIFSKINSFNKWKQSRWVFFISYNMPCLKGSVSRDFRPSFFSWYEPFWATDKQAKIFSNLVSISPKNSNIWALKVVLSPRCAAAPQRQNNKQLSDQISWRNRNRIRKYFSLFIMGPDGFESWKKRKLKISWHTPFKGK